MLLLRLLRALDVLACTGPALCLVALLFLAKNRLLKELAAPGAILAAKALVVLMMSLPMLVLDPAVSASMQQVWNGLAAADLLLSAILLIYLVLKKLWRRFLPVTMLAIVGLISTIALGAIRYAMQSFQLTPQRAYVTSVYSYWGTLFVATMLWLVIGVAAARMVLRNQAQAS